jgi:hypothetical protein
MKHSILLLIALFALGCSRDTETGKLWHKADEFIVIEERYLTKEQADVLKSHLSDDLKYDSIGRFYARQSVVERIVKTPLIVLVTPFTVIIDGLSMVVCGVADIGPPDHRNTGSVADARLIGALIEALVHKW